MGFMLSCGALRLAVLLSFLATAVLGSGVSSPSSCKNKKSYSGSSGTITFDANEHQDAKDDSSSSKCYWIVCDEKRYVHLTFTSFDVQQSGADCRESVTIVEKTDEGNTGTSNEMCGSIIPSYRVGHLNYDEERGVAVIVNVDDGDDISTFTMDYTCTNTNAFAWGPVPVTCPSYAYAPSLQMSAGDVETHPFATNGDSFCARWYCPVDMTVQFVSRTLSGMGMGMGMFSCVSSSVVQVAADTGVNEEFCKSCSGNACESVEVAGGGTAVLGYRAEGPSPMGDAFEVRVLCGATVAPDTDVPATPAPPTPAPEMDAPATTAPDTNVPPTDAPATPAPDTGVPLTLAPPTPAPATNVPTTPAPGTDAPPTDAPATQAPATPAPPTPAPQTASPTAPATPAPLTPAPATPAPQTPAPQTPAPPTLAPLTAAPPTVAPTQAPPTAAPPTSAPATPAPQTASPTAPATPAPLTPAPATPAPQTPAPQTPAPPTVVPTQAPPTPAPPTPAPATATPPTPAPPTPAPATIAPLTPAPATPAPATSAPSTPTPATPAPSTPAPSTPAPATPVPATPSPPTPAPPTPAPPTPTPPTPAPATPSPPTPTPATLSPATPAPRTEPPATPSPPTPAPATPAPTQPPTRLPATLAPAATGAPATPGPPTPAPDTAVPEPETAPPTMLGVSGATRLGLPADTKESLEATNSAAAASSLLSGATGAGTAGKLALLKNFGCELDDVDVDDGPLDWEFHPTLGGFGGGIGKYRIAAMLMNPVLVAAVALISLCATGAIHALTKSTCLRRSAGLARTPGIIYVPYIFLLQGTSLVAAQICFDPTRYDAGTLLLARTSLAGCLASPAVLWWFVLRRVESRAEVTPDPLVFGPPATGGASGGGVGKYHGNRLYRFAFGDYVWVSFDEAGYFVEQVGVIFENLRPGHLRHTLFEVASILALSLLSAWKPTTVDTCNIRNYIISLIMLLFLLACVVFRPYIAPMDNAIAIGLAALMAVAVVFMSIAITAGSGEDSPLYTIATFCLFISAIAVMLKCIWDFVMYGMDVCMARRSGARSAHREAAFSQQTQEVKLDDLGPADSTQGYLNFDEAAVSRGSGLSVSRASSESGGSPASQREVRTPLMRGVQPQHVQSSHSLMAMALSSPSPHDNMGVLSVSQMNPSIADMSLSSSSILPERGLPPRRKRPSVAVNQVWV